jgi:hypothetical protein
LKFIDVASALSPIGGFAVVAAILFWGTIGLVGNSAINHSLVNVGIEVMVQVDYVDRRSFIQTTRYP